METTALVNALVFIIVSGIVIFVGLDLKKWYSWLFGLYGFLSGFLVGYLRTGTPLGLQLGVIFAFEIICGGAVIGWRKHYYKKEAESWLSRQGQEKHYSFLARMIRKMLNKWLRKSAG